MAWIVAEELRINFLYWLKNIAEKTDEQDRWWYRKAILLHFFTRFVKIAGLEWHNLFLIRCFGGLVNAVERFIGYL